MLPSNKLVIGTAQFGQDYGITNISGKVPMQEIKSIIKTARFNEICHLDTARTYGDSELILGNIGVSDFDIITKLSASDCLNSKINESYKNSVKLSLKELKVTRLDTVLLHKPDELLSPYGDQIYKSLLSLKEDGLVARIGVSLYSPELLDDIYEKYSFDVVQVPINVFDRRIISSGWLSRLFDDGVSVMARSVFLQGILLSKIKDLPDYFTKWKTLFNQWEEFYQKNSLSALEASLGFVTQIPEIDKIIVGIESDNQLSQIINSANNYLEVESNHLETSDLDLISPIQWPF